MSVNKVILIGNVGKDPELLDTTNGAKYPNNMTVTIGLNANF